MNRWSRIDRRALLRRAAWAVGASLALHAAILAVVELPDPEAMQRAQWPQVDVRFARLTASSDSEKPSPDAPLAHSTEVFDAAAAAPRRPQPGTVAKARRAVSAPRAIALRMSEPRTKPPSTTISARPATAAATSGRTSIVARPWSSWRPPWLET